MTYAPGTWYTEWSMEETPEQARYTSSLQLFYIDQEKAPVRRYLRLRAGAAPFAASGQHGPLLADLRL